MVSHLHVESQKKKKKKGQTQRNKVGNWLSGAGKWGNRETLVKDDE